MPSKVQLSTYNSTNLVTQKTAFQQLTSVSMAPHTPSFVARHAGVKLFPYSTSPGSDKHMKAFISVAGARPAQQLSQSSSNMHCFPNRKIKSTAGRTAAAAMPDNTPATEQVDPETARLLTAASILGASESGSDCETPFDSADDDSTVSDNLHSLSVLDDLTVLDADSLSLAVGIIRQHLPIDADEADVQLSERLRDLLVLLRQRPSKAYAASGSGMQPAALLPSAPALDGAAAATTDDGFWAGPDEWSDVRSALMSIGINTSVDEDDDESVWTIEEEGPARRTRLLKSLPRLDADTAAELAAFLAGLQQRSGAANTAADDVNLGSGSSCDGSKAVDEEQVEVDEEEERWWGEVTQAYQKVWQQAQLQQAKPVTQTVG